MSEKQEQVKPLAPAANRIIDIDETGQLGEVDFMSGHHRRCIKCCGCSFAFLLIISTVILVLMFTGFHVKDPILKIEFANIQGRNDTSIGPVPNMTVEAHISIKNPNMGAFKFANTTTNVYYDGSIIGEKNILAGRVRARKTLRVNVTVELMMDKIWEVGRSRDDFGRGIFPISSYMSITGKVKIGSVVKKSFLVRLNCTMNLNMRRHEIEDQNCGRKV